VQRRDFLRACAAAAGFTKWGTALAATQSQPASRPAPSRPPARRTPVVASPWRRIIEYPEHHLNDFCLFQDAKDLWHAIGIMGTGTWDSKRLLFRSVGRSLTDRFTNLDPVLAQPPPAPAIAPQKHAPFVVLYEGTYHLFYRRPPGTILHVRSADPARWSDLGAEVFAERDARDVHVIRIGRSFRMFYCQCAEVDGVLRSCILMRESADLNRWSEPIVVHADTARPCTHSYLESPCVVHRPEGFYLFIRHQLMNDRTTTVVLFSTRPDRFPSGERAWFCELNDVHAAEIVTDGGNDVIARVSGAPHANPHAPAKGGWIDVARLQFM
jgi:hypothetical protein